MSVDMRVRFEGLADINRAINQLAQDSPAVAKQEVAKASLELQRWAKKFCPVVTGRLRASIAVDFYPGGMTADVGTSVWYGPFVEFGTTKQRAHPYLQPAWDLVHPRFRESLKQTFKVHVKREWPG